LKISVIITSYNQKNYLREAIESVLEQTLLPYEIIIVDDCSSDSSQDMVLDYARRYPGLIRAFCHKKGLGIPKNRNFALERVKGDFVCSLDGDDRFLPDKLRRELETMQQHPEAMLVFSNVYFIDEEGQRLALWAETSPPPTGYVFKEAFCRHWPKGSLYRNELVNINALKQVGFYDEDLDIYEDWDLKIRFTSRFKVAYCAAPLAEYRQHPKGISRRSSMELHLNTMKRIYEKNYYLLGELLAKDREEVEKILSSKFRLLKASAAVERGQRGEALREYVRYVIENLFRPGEWMALLKFLLASGASSSASSIIARIRKGKSS